MFPAYRMDHQFDVLRLVAELSDVPVPAVRWIEPTGELLGSPFFLMDHVGRRAPRCDALHLRRELVRRRTGRETTGTAGQHGGGAGAAARDPRRCNHIRLPSPTPTRPATPAAPTLHLAQDWYEFAVPGIGRSPLVERALAWLEENFPAEIAAGEPVLAWGDSRIGNVLYHDFRPVAVLDWEMACVGPRELDVAWIIFAHMVFQELAGLAGLPGCPT